MKNFSVKTFNISEFSEKILDQAAQYDMMSDWLVPSKVNINFSTGSTASFYSKDLHKISQLIEEFRNSGGNHPVRISGVTIIPNPITGYVSCIISSDLPKGTFSVNNTWITVQADGDFQYEHRHPESTEQIIRDYEAKANEKPDERIVERLQKLNAVFNKTMDNKIELGKTVHEALDEWQHEGFSWLAAVIVPGGDKIFKGMSSRNSTIGDDMILKNEETVGNEKPPLSENDKNKSISDDDKALLSERDTDKEKSTPEDDKSLLTESDKDKSTTGEDQGFFNEKSGQEQNILNKSNTENEKATSEDDLGFFTEKSGQEQSVLNESDTDNEKSISDDDQGFFTEKSGQEQSVLNESDTDNEKSTSDDDQGFFTEKSGQEQSVPNESDTDNDDNDNIALQQDDFLKQQHQHDVDNNDHQNNQFDVDPTR